MKWVWLAIASLAIVIFMPVILPVINPDLLDQTVCNAEKFPIANPNTGEVHATKVVVQPWKGRHQFYGIFVIPIIYVDGYPALLKVKGIKPICRRVMNTSPKSIDGISAPSGGTVLKLYLRTRVAFWLMITGQLKDLEKPEHWTLSYSYYTNYIGICKPLTPQRKN